MSLTATAGDEEPTARSLFALTAVADGEVRDAEGNLLSTTRETQTVEVTADRLQVFTDEQLKAAGLDDATIADIRSST